MRKVARQANHAGHDAELVELDQRFWQIEVDGAAAHALAIQDQRQFLHQLEAWKQIPVAVAQSGVAFEQQVDIGVRHALGAANDAAHEFLRHQIALMIEFQQRREHQAVYVRVE